MHYFARNEKSDDDAESKGVDGGWWRLLSPPFFSHCAPGISEYFPSPIFLGCPKPFFLSSSQEGGA